MAAKKKTKPKSKSRVNEAGNYTKPTLRKRLFERIKRGTKGGKAGQWSARKAQMLAKRYVLYSQIQATVLYCNADLRLH